MKVSTTEFLKCFGALADKALGEPVIITRNGRDRLVVLSAEEYARLKRAAEAVPSPEPGKPGKRHPLFGLLKDVTHIPPGVDLTEPADPEWGRLNRRSRRAR